VLSGSFVVLLDRWLVDLDALCFDDIPDSLLEPEKVLRRESVSFGDDWDEVDSSAKSLHDFDVEGLEGMACRADEVEAGMDSEVNLVVAAWLLFLQHIRLMLIVKELNNGLPRVAVVHVVAEAGSVNDCQPYCTGSVSQHQEVGMSGIPLKNFSSSSAFVISISTVLSTCFACLRLWSA